MINPSDGVIRLRQFTLEDAEAQLAADDDENIKWLNSGKKSTLESVRNWILKNQNFWENDGPVFAFAVELISENKIIGAVEANTNHKNFPRFKEGDVNISYMTYPDYRRKGYASKAVLLILNFLKEKNFKRAIINVHKDNKGSLKIPVKCEFIEIGSFIGKNGEEMIEFIKALDFHKSQ